MVNKSRLGELMKIHWLTGGNPQGLRQLEQSTLASTRLRAAVAFGAISKLRLSISAGESAPSAVDKLVIGKIGVENIATRKKLWLDQIRRLRGGGATVYLDYTDHHLGFESQLSDFYRSVLELVDYCICPSASMQTLLKSFWSGPSRVIVDAIEVDAVLPKLSAQSPRTALWFGHATNVPYLRAFIEQKFEPKQQVRIIALTNESGANFLIRPSIRLHPNVRLEIGPWSLHGMLQAAKVSDFCIIPGDPLDPKKAGVSANRLVTALALGLPTAADALPAYREFSGYYTDLRSTELGSLVIEPTRYREQVLHAQSELVPLFSKSVLGKAWEQFLNA